MLAHLEVAREVLATLGAHAAEPVIYQNGQIAAGARVLLDLIRRAQRARAVGHSAASPAVALALWWLR